MEGAPRFIWFFVGFPILVVLYLFFLMAIAAVNRSRSRRLRDLLIDGRKAGTSPRLVLFKAEQFLQSLHAGLLLVAMLAGYFAINISGSEGLWGWIVNHYPPLSANSIVQCISKGIFFFLIAAGALIFTLLAKALAYSQPEKLLLILARPILTAHRLLSPLVSPVKSITTAILSLFGIGLPLEFERALSAEELTEMVQLSTKAGEIEAGEQEMIESVLLFSDTLVEEVMTPRGRIASIAIDATFKTVVDTFKTEGFSRLVVTGKDLDDVRGVLLAKDIFSWINLDKSTFSVQKILRRAFFVQHSRKIDELLKDLRRDKTHLAIVLDEHGGVDGIVTVEDLIEELVGEIADEFDQSEITEESPIDRDDIIVEGSLSVDDFNTRYNLALPTGEYDTVAGFVLALMGRIPQQGDSVCHEGLLITVIGVEQNRLTSIRVQRDAESLQGPESLSRRVGQVSEISGENAGVIEVEEMPALRILTSK
jgi:putative hemolysin